MENSVTDPLFKFLDDNLLLAPLGLEALPEVSYGGHIFNQPWPSKSTSNMTART